MENDPYLYELVLATDRRFALRPRCPVYVVRYCGRVIGHVQRRFEDQRWRGVLPNGMTIPGSYARRRDAARVLDWSVNG